MLAEILRLYSYNRWATERALGAVAALPDGRYDQSVGGSFASLRATLEHMLQAEGIWLSRWRGDALGEKPDVSRCGTAQALGARWAELWADQGRFLATLSEADLARPLAVRTRSGIEAAPPLGETLLHVVNHATYHRGQVTTLLRQLGGEPVSTDLFLFGVAQAAPSAPAVPAAR